MGCGALVGYVVSTQRQKKIDRKTLYIETVVLSSSHCSVAHQSPVPSAASELLG